MRQVHLKRKGCEKLGYEEWRQRLYKLPDTQERNVAAMALCSHLLGHSQCTLGDKPPLGHEWHMRYRLNGALPNKEKTIAALEAIGVPNHIATTWCGCPKLETFIKPPKDDDRLLDRMRRDLRRYTTSGMESEDNTTEETVV